MEERGGLKANWTSARRHCFAFPQEVEFKAATLASTSEFGPKRSGRHLVAGLTNLGNSRGAA